MEIVYESEGFIQFVEDEAEHTHAPDNDELWQESFVLYFWDSERKCYSFLRIAQTPNYKGGTAQIMLNIWTPAGFYKHTDDLVPFDGKGRQPTSLTIGDNLVSYSFDGNFHWKIDDPKYGVTADLSFTGYHRGINPMPQNESVVRHASANHTQAFGSVKGEVSVNGKTFKIDGYGWRDHSWGSRNWLSIRCHRFFPAIFSKDTYLTNVTFVGGDGQLGKSAVLVKDGKMFFTRDITMVAYMGEDAVSNCGGRATVKAGGETLVFEYEPIAKSSVIMVHGLAMTEGMCRVRWGDKIGVGVTETTTNPHGGSERPFVFPSSPGVIDNGVHQL
jgi:hypothetical protein